MSIRKLPVICFVLLLLTACPWGLFWSRLELDSLRVKFQVDHDQRPPLYLPEAKFVKLITLGYDRFFADIFWFQTLNYFGKQFRSTKDYRWLAEMCDLVTLLDGRAQHVVEFCASMLSWMARQPERSNELLSRAMDVEPHYWRYPYLRGFNQWYFLDKKNLAQSDFMFAATLPEAPSFLGSLASRLIVDQDNPQLAIDFLRELLSRSQETAEKEALKEKLELAVLARDVRFLQDKVSTFESLYQRSPQDLSELVDAGLINVVAKDPWGSKYQINIQGQVESSSGKKPLTFQGKTAQTGLAQSLE